MIHREGLNGGMSNWLEFRILNKTGIKGRGHRNLVVTGCLVGTSSNLSITYFFVRLWPNILIFYSFFQNPVNTHCCDWCRRVRVEESYCEDCRTKMLFGQVSIYEWRYQFYLLLCTYLNCEINMIDFENSEIVSMCVYSLPLFMLRAAFYCQFCRLR